MASGKLLRRYTGHAERVLSAAFSPDGRYLLSGGGGQYVDGKSLPGYDFTLRLWEVPQLEDEQR